MLRLLIAFTGIVASVALFVGSAAAQSVKLLNASYDPTRELYEELNDAFRAHYKSETGVEVRIEQSHGGSSKQSRAVIDGLKADVVTLALGWDVSAVEKAGLIQPDWRERLPNNASPYTSTIVFVVRKGNPKGIKDWNDLIRHDVKIVTPNPKTSGGARWTFLAGYGWAGGATGGKVDDAKGSEYIKKFYKNVPVLDTGARGSTVSFTQKNVADVLPTWENEACLTIEEFGKDKYEIVYPSASILAEPPVAVVDKVVDAKGTRKAAEAYLNFLYTPEAQEIIAALRYRPRSADVLKKHAELLPPLPLFTIDEAFGGWDAAQKKFFADGGVFDQIYAPGE